MCGPSSSSKLLPSTLGFSWSFRHITVCHYLIMLRCGVLAMRCLRCKMKKLSKFVGDESATYINSSFICSQSKPRFHGAEANEKPNKAQSEKTLPCFQLHLFDVAASGDLDIISCPSSKRHQTRCCIQNQITEPGPKCGVCECSLHCILVSVCT